MTSIFAIVANLLGTLILGLLALALVVELILRAIRFVDDTLLSVPVTRKDFLAEGYQDYIGWVEDWSKPMFQYLPVGFRHFNVDNPIPNKVENNSLGFRCREFDQMDPEAFRVVVLGGSAAWGSGATSNQGTIAGQLEILLNENQELLGGPKSAQCYNLAQVNGYQTQDLLTTIFFASRIRPHVVVSFTGWNELAANDVMRKEHLEKYGAFYIDEMEGWEPTSVIGNKTRHLGEALRMWGEERFEIVRKFQPQPARAQADPVTAFKERLALGAKLFEWHLETIQTLAHAYSFTHLQFMQPYVYRKKHLTEQEKRIVELYDEVRPVHGGVATGDYLRQNNIYRPLLDSLAESGDESVGAVFDLCDVFREETESRFYTLVHLNDEGYLEVARRIRDAVRETRGVRSEAVLR